MSNFSWKVKQWFRKMLPLALIVAVLYGGYHLYRQGTFRRGLKPAITSMLHKLPYFGSRYKHYNRSQSYSYGSKYGHGKRRGGRRHHSRRSRRGRRR